jgi:hypothetical protein
MRCRQAQCPACGTLLNVPPGCGNCKVRCGQCGHRFRLPRRIHVTEEAISDWLRVDVDRSKPAVPAVADSDRTHVAMPAVQTAAREDLRILRLGRGGVVFEFPARRLMETHFRSALPRRCARCRSKNHLRAHPIIFEKILRVGGPAAERSRQLAEQADVRLQQVRKLPAEELLDRLPRIPDAPPPGDLPMPFWLCDLCSPRETVAGQICTDSSGENLARLYIRNLLIAQGFLSAAGPVATGDEDRLKRYVAKRKENPWDSMPETVQQRIETWFHPGDGERFMAYIPDHHRTRTEDGLAGLLVSDRRLIFHTALTHREVPCSMSLRVQLSTEGEHADIRVSTPTWEVTHMTIHREDLPKLRRALFSGQFDAKWK